MAKHRSLSNALLSPEKMAFITGQEIGEPSHDEQPIIQAEPVVVPVVELGSNTTETSQNNATEVGPSTDRRDIAKASPAAPANDDYLVAITTRLQARTADALRRAYLEQKLSRQEPGTQQEIIEIAVQQWLRQNSYLK